jgi:hypothetical protein
MPSSRMNGSRPPMMLSRLVPLLVAFTVTLWARRSAVRLWSLSAIGMREV